MGCDNSKNKNNNQKENFNNDVKLKIAGQQKINEYEIKICLLGDINVGKTSIASRFCKNSFNENYINTIGGA